METTLGVVALLFDVSCFLAYLCCLLEKESCCIFCVLLYTAVVFIFCLHFFRFFGQRLSE